MNPDAFEEIQKVAAVMADFRRPWFIAGGWAIDLFLGYISRVHRDVDIAILRNDQNILHSYLRDWKLEKVVPREGGSSMEPWLAGERLELPIHEIHARRPTKDPYRLEFLLNESDRESWRFRRHLEITRPLEMIGYRSRQEVPFLRPEIVLLYKAKHHEERDERDFRSVHAALGNEAKRWLGESLEVCHPGHPWLVDGSPPSPAPRRGP